MSLRNSQPDYEFSNTKGVDSTSPIAIVQQGYIRKGQNVDVGITGGYSKRFGYENQLSTPYGSRDITAGIEYKSGASIQRTIVFGTDNTGTGGRYGFISGGTVTNISTGLSGTTRPAFIQFSDLLFFYNGVDSPQLYDGSGTRQVGITAPVNAPTYTSQSTAGDLTQLASYIFAYTYYNSTTGAESSPSPFSDPVTLTGTNDEITMGITAGDSTTADLIRIYRTTGNGNTLFLDQEIAIASTSFSSTQEDAGLGRQIELDNTRITQLSTTAKFPAVVDNRVFLKTGANEIRFSKMGQEGPMPESFEVKSVVPTVGRRGRNDDIVGINRINQLPIVLKEFSVGRLDPFGLPDNTQALDNVGYTYREISDAHGAICHEAACQVFGEVVFLGRDNVYATNGIEVRPIADKIQADIRNYGFTAVQRPRLSAINDSENQKVYISIFATESAADPTVILTGDYQAYPEFRWTTYEPGDDVTTHPGLKVGCFVNNTNPLTGKQDTLFGNVVANGKFYKMNEGDNDDGSPIFMRLITRPYMGGNPLAYKLYKKAEIQAKGNGDDYNLTVCTIYDLTGQEEECIPLSLFGSGALYDAVTSLYDTTLWADDAFKSIEYYMHRKAKYLQLVFKQTEADAPVEIFSWGTYASGFGPNEGPRKTEE